MVTSRVSCCGWWKQWICFLSCLIGYVNVVNTRRHQQVSSRVLDLVAGASNLEVDMVDFGNCKEQIIQHGPTPLVKQLQIAWSKPGSQLSVQKRNKNSEPGSIWNQTSMQLFDTFKLLPLHFAQNKISPHKHQGSKLLKIPLASASEMCQTGYQREHFWVRTLVQRSERQLLNFCLLKPICMIFDVYILYIYTGQGIIQQEKGISTLPPWDAEAWAWAVPGEYLHNLESMKDSLQPEHASAWIQFQLMWTRWRNPPISLAQLLRQKNLQD